MNHAEYSPDLVKPPRCLHLLDDSQIPGYETICLICGELDPGRTEWPAVEVEHSITVREEVILMSRPVFAECTCGWISHLQPHLFGAQ